MRRIGRVLWWGLVLAGGAVAGDFDHTRFDELLARYAADGRVRYGRLLGERQGLDGAAQALNLIDPGELDEGDARKAFWINAYNLLVIRALVEAQPVSRVTDVAGFFEEPRHPVGGDKVSLDRILNDELRKKFADPRIVFATVPGSVSGPTLGAKAFRAEDLDEALTARTKAFLAREDAVVVDEAGRVVHVSPMFEWYAADFVPADKPVEPEAAWRKFLVEHAPPAVRAVLEEATPYRVQADLPYDWTLNDALLAKKKRWSWPWVKAGAGGASATDAAVASPGGLHDAMDPGAVAVEAAAAAEGATATPAPASPAPEEAASPSPASAP